MNPRTVDPEVSVVDLESINLEAAQTEPVQPSEPVSADPTGPRILGTDLLSAVLPHEFLPADEVVAGQPSAAAVELGHVGEAAVGIWEMSEGCARDTEADEIFIVLSGSGLVEFADGERLALAPGVAVRLGAGERTVWTVQETLRKVYIAR